MKRPVLRYHGGKFRLRSWILSLMRPHKLYCEPFGGAGSVLLSKPRAYYEVLGDTDRSVIRLFRTLRHPERAARLRELLALTPYSRVEHQEAMAADLSAIEDDCEASRLLIVRAFMGHGGDCASNGRYPTGFRVQKCWERQQVARQWSTYPEALAGFTARLAGVVIESQPALVTIRQVDSPQALHYCDPPYVHATRRAHGKGVRGYNHEMTEADHVELLGVLNACRGAVLVSGYAHPLYEEMLAGWERFERRANSDGGGAYRGGLAEARRLTYRPTSPLPTPPSLT